jgi:hypothetical protein
MMPCTGTEAMMVGGYVPDFDEIIFCADLCAWKTMGYIVGTTARRACELE